jgi:hypothetical protein
MRAISPSGQARFQRKNIHGQLLLTESDSDDSYRFLKIGASYGFVMHAVLALSATHIGWLTDCPHVKQIAYEHRGVALKGLHEAIGSFSRQNSDAVLAASLLLSWQATEW